MEIQTSLGKPPARHLSYGLNPLVTLLKEHAIDPGPLLEKAGIPEDALTTPTYHMTPHQELGFIELIIEALNQPDLGLTVGSRYHLSAYGILGLAIMTSENLLSAMQVLYKNILMTWTYMHWSTTVRDDKAYISLSKLRDLGGCHQYMIDRGLVASRIIYQEALGEPIPLQGVYMTQREPTYAKRYEELFQCPIHFQAPENYYCFDAALLYKRLPQAEPETARIYARECEKICAQLAKDQTFSDIVRNHILASPREIFTLETLADKLGMTSRTVQRKLDRENTSYKEILEEVRRNLAIEYLQTTNFTLEDISVRLGYSDASSFCHAFKRWTGLNPKDARQR